MAKILVLGGSEQARHLLDGLRPKVRSHIVLSLAGRTRNPRLWPDIETRIGGFGGVDGLISYMRAQNITAVVDATHPFAQNMSANALAACEELRRPLVRLSRELWQQQADDNWHKFADISALIAKLAGPRKRIFLTHGRQYLALFAQQPQHFYLVRSIEPPPDIEKLPHAHLLLARGPFQFTEEQMLMQHFAIDVLVSKHSGAAATYAKIAAARARKIPVYLLLPPYEAEAKTDIATALGFIELHV